MKPFVIKLIIILITSRICFGQEEKVLIHTPESASLIKWSQNDVNFSSGALNTSIPIHTLTDGGLTVPIGIHYNGSSGIKVDEAATWVGLGWDLMAGGKIVRVVRDKPDEGYTMSDKKNEKGSFFEGFSLGYSPTILGSNLFEVAWDQEKIIYRGGWAFQGNPTSRPEFSDSDPVLYDSQPDLYIVNINGDVIKFTLDNYGHPVILNNKDYKIEYQWQTYNPSDFYTKKNWNFNVNGNVLDLIGGDTEGNYKKSYENQQKSSSGILSNGQVGQLSLTIGLNQFFRGTNDLPKEIGFKGWVVTNSNGEKYYFGGSQEFMDFNFNDQSYMNDVSRLSIAVNNMHQRLPSAWNLRKIEAPFGQTSAHNTIDFKYKRTAYYEHFNASDDLVNPSGPCDIPSAKQDRANINLNFAVKDFSFSAPSLDDLNAFVTLNTRVVFGTQLQQINSSNFIVNFNSPNLLNKPISKVKFKEISPDFNNDDYYDLVRKDLQKEISLSSDEEKRKGFVDYNPLNGNVKISYKDFSVNFGGPAIFGFAGTTTPNVTFDNGNVYASLNANGALAVSVTGKVFHVDLNGEFNLLSSSHECLKNIEIIDRGTGKTKAFYLDQDYFESANPQNIGNIGELLAFARHPDDVSDLPASYYIQLHYKYGIKVREDTKRLRLKGIYELNFKEDSLSIYPGYSFKYNNTIMPRRLSMAQDHWGYYNGEHQNRNKTQFISRMSYKTYEMNGTTLIEEGNLICPNSSDRKAVLAFAKVGILEKIIFPTGASKTFEYELNKASNFTPNIGGLRIKSIETFEPISQKKYAESYEYLDATGKSSGRLSVIPEYYFNHVGNNAPNVVLTNYYNSLLSNFVNDGVISYERVVRKNIQNGISNGYEVFEFNNNEISAIKETSSLVGGATLIKSQSNSFFDLDKKPLYDYSKNSLKKVTIFNKQNQIVKSIEYTYSDIFSNDNVTYVINAGDVVRRKNIYKLSVGVSYSIKIVPLPPFVIPGIGFDTRLNTEKSAEYYPFQIKTRRYDLLTEKETIWDLNGQNPIISEKSYKYSFNHHNPIETTQINSKGQEIKNNITYSFDINAESPVRVIEFSSLPDLENKIDPIQYNELRKKYINLPIEEISLVDGQVVGGKFMDIYKDEPNFDKIGLPKVEFMLELDAPVAFAQFNKAAVVSYHRRVNNSTNTGYEDQYYNRFIKDSRYVPRVFLEEYNSKGLPTKYRKSGDPVTQVGYGFYDLIPTSKTVAFGTPLARTTTYEYIPLYGLTRITNPNLTGQKYDYDDVGRLKAVRNEQNEILKSYVYKILGF
jgi:hypothetical protein